MALAVMLPLAVRWQCPLLPRTARLEGSFLCVRRSDLVNVQREESHAGAEEEHEQVLGTEGHQIALHKFMKYCNGDLELRNFLLHHLRRKTERRRFSRG